MAPPRRTAEPKRLSSGTLTLSGATVVALLMAGCAPAADAPNPWAEFRPDAQVAPSVAPTATLDEHLPQPPIVVNVDEAPRFEFNDTSRRCSPQQSQKTGENYPPPAPPAEASDVLAAADVISDVPAHWTGAVLYCQPGCVPCAMQIRDLRKAGWKCGVGESNHFKIVELLTLADFEKRNVPSTPQTVYYVDGAEQAPRVTGYGGTTAELAAIVTRHPKVKRTSRVSTATSYGASPPWYETPRTNCGAPVSSSNCAAPTIASCAAPASGFAIEAAPVAVTYAAPPVYFAAPTPVYAHSALTIGPATHSAQLNLFGFPLIGGSVGSTMSW
ncbi:MAG TPA: hypothetical protein VGP63_13405 [Planctomycetaceae bacterium]|nr:hypothetical protein [Planctomycetaceae bacterium]